MGGLDRYIDRYFGRYIGRCIGRYSTEYRSLYRSSVDGYVSTDSPLNDTHGVGRHIDRDTVSGMSIHDPISLMSFMLGSKQSPFLPLYLLG